LIEKDIIEVLSLDVSMVGGTKIQALIDRYEALEKYHDPKDFKYIKNNYKIKDKKAYFKNSYGRQGKPYLPNFDKYGDISLRERLKQRGKVAKWFKKSDNAPKGRLRDYYFSNVSGTNSSKEKIVELIMVDVLYLMILDAMQGDLISLSRTKFYPVLYVKMISMQEFSSYPTDSVLFQGLDVIKTGFKVPVVTISFGPESKHDDVMIRLPKTFRDKLYAAANSGVKYVSLK